MVEIIMAMEDEFQLTFTDENIKISSVQDIVEYMNRALTEQGNV
jgi:acyl carrier protein